MQSIPINTIIECKNTLVAEPIKGLRIPNISIPDHLKDIKKTNIDIEVRILFNCLSKNNIEEMSKKLVSVTEKAKDANDIELITKEIFASFLVSKDRVEDCMPLLNAADYACVLLKGSKTTQRIGNIFIEQCRKAITDKIKLDNIKKLALYNTTKVDEEDEYNKEREIITCIIFTLCLLYEQKNTTMIKLMADHLIPLISVIQDNFFRCLERVVGKDDIPSRMACLYVEQLYLFFSRLGKTFLQDDKTVNGVKLADLVNRFREEIVPAISRESLRYRCTSIEFD